MTLQKIIIITGPTASGKSALAVEVAERVGGRIVSADSAAVYRHLDIGTAKPTPAERERVRHYLIDVADPDQQYNAMTYVRAADEAVGEIAAAGDVPIVVGGAGLYLKALVFGIFELPGGSSEEGAAIREALEAVSTDRLREELECVDAASARRIGPNDRVRIVRALEIYRRTGVTKSDLEARHGFAGRRYDALTFGLFMERAPLNERIDRRVDEMIASGMVAEVRELLGMGYGRQSPGLSTIGYREIVDHLSGGPDLVETVSLIKRNTRRYAKRQMTWFRKIDEIRWITKPYNVNEVVGAVRDYLSEGARR
jgi:tRNA dimethylallyltransferase